MDDEQEANYWREQYFTLRDSLIRFYTTARGTSWQACRICGHSDGAVRILEHNLDCPLWKDL